MLRSMTASNLPSSFSNRTVVVTGGTGALGRAVVGRLLELGAEVRVPWIRRDELADFPFATAVTLVETDLTDEAAVGALYEDLSPWASIHVAGGFAMAPVTETSADDVLDMFRLNALSCLLCCREAIRVMRRTRSGGRIVNIGARPAVTPTGGMVAYSLSKAAVTSMTLSLAEEVKSDGILVNAVLPSIMDTPANRKAMPEVNHATWPKVEEVAATIVWLASEANALTSGALVPVYGRE